MVSAARLGRLVVPRRFAKPISVRRFARYSTAFNVFTDDFATTANPIGSPWIGPNAAMLAEGFTELQTASGNCYGTVASDTGFPDAYAFVTGFGNNHEVEGTVHRNNPPNFNHEIELHLRATQTTTRLTLYEVLISRHAAFQIMTWDTDRPGDFFQEITGNGTGPGLGGVEPANGDKFRSRAVGSQITVFHRPISTGIESEIWTGSDSLFPTGSPGIAAFYRAGATPSTFGFQAVTLRNV